MRNKILLFVSLSVLMTSCGEYGVSRHLRDFMDSTISIPNDIQVVSERHVHQVAASIIAGSKLVILYDSLECSSCQIGHLYDYLWSYEKLDSIQSCQLMTIFSPRQEEYDEVVRQLMVLNFPYPIYVDMSGSFRKINKCIPDDKRFHSFLLDRDGHPVFIGKPAASEQLWMLFKEVLANLEANGGVYVEPEER